MRKILISLVSLVAPFITYGASVSAPRDFKGLVAIFTDIIGTLVILTFALTFLAFMWGVVKGWIIHGGESDGIETGKNVVLTSIIALVVMSSIWGILRLLQSSLF
jgi:hypothetical protein